MKIMRLFLWLVKLKWRLEALNSVGLFCITLRQCPWITARTTNRKRASKITHDPSSPTVEFPLEFSAFCLLFPRKTNETLLFPCKKSIIMPPFAGRGVCQTRLSTKPLSRILLQWPH
ncbi:hypothetical protein EDB82DRAFT_172351 [Fusarium venenatum]|uniref:uncharacterized protein n=1 Tax=Fusarium venenatum TaxID=56646 RepID=UPI001D9F5740|nr:hypothetical protein EDB82DRAFT_172351 [Fusarium venenatum]